MTLTPTLYKALTPNPNPNQVAESYATLEDGSRDNIWLYTGRGAADGKDSIEERCRQ